MNTERVSLGTGFKLYCSKPFCSNDSKPRSQTDTSNISNGCYCIGSALAPRAIAETKRFLLHIESFIFYPKQHCLEMNSADDQFQPFFT